MERKTHWTEPTRYPGHGEEGLSEELAYRSPALFKEIAYARAIPHFCPGGTAR
jgi:hypothetical protein